MQIGLSVKTITRKYSYVTAGGVPHTVYPVHGVCAVLKREIPLCTAGYPFPSWFWPGRGYPCPISCLGYPLLLGRRPGTRGWGTLFLLERTWDLRMEKEAGTRDWDTTPSPDPPGDRNTPAKTILSRRTGVPGR